MGAPHKVRPKAFASPRQVAWMSENGGAEIGGGRHRDRFHLFNVNGRSWTRTTFAISLELLALQIYNLMSIFVDATFQLVGPTQN